MMQLPYEIIIALRYLRAKKKQSFISIITLISVAGVAIGVMALILVLGVMTGFADDLREKILGTNSHIVITRFGSNMSSYRDVRRQIDAVPDVAASTPFILSQVMLSSGSRVSGAVLRGLDVDTAPRVIDIGDTLVEGNLDALRPDGADKKETANPGIIIGKELAQILGVYPGAALTVISPSGLLSPAGMVPRWKKFRVAGIFESGMYEYDTGIAYVGINTAQSFLKMGDAVTGVEVKVQDIFDTEHVVRDIQAVLGSGYSVRDWKQMHRNLYSALKLEKTAMFVILILIIIVAAFSIVATLIMMVNDKNREIAILKSMGATSGSLLKIFMLQGLVIGCTGTVLGIAGGTALAYLQNTYQIVALSKDVYYIASLSVKMQFWDTFWVGFCAVAISFLATVYPSAQAARMDPVEALRYE